jgi:gas vesicle protein
MNEEKKQGNFWIGFFLGGIFGLILVFLYSTKEGKKIARSLLEKGEILEEGIEEKLALLEGKGEEMLEEAEKLKKEIVKKVNRNAKKVGKVVVTKVQETKDKVEDLEKKSASLTASVESAVSKKFFRKNGKKLSA